MIIILIIYLLIIGYIILKAFYTTFISIKPFNKNQNIEKFSDSINYISIPFYINMPKIYLLCIFINLILIGLLFLPNIMNDLILLIFNNNIAYCQDSYDSDSTIDSDNEKSIVKYYGENDIYEINKNRKEEIERDESEYGSRDYYPDNYEGIYKKTIEETYRISDIKFPYIHLLNSFSNFENANDIKINNYLKVFQGFSKDIENLIEKQNNLIQKITPIDKHSFKISRISNMFYEISKRSMDTLVLISFAYDNIMDSFYNDKNIEYNYDSDDHSFFNSKEHEFYKSSIYYLNKSENSNEYKFFNEILNNKTHGNIDINKNIKSFLGDHQVNNLNFKITKIFNSLEIIQKISKENFNNLHELIAHPRELTDLNLKINNSNISIIQDIYNRIPEENQIKTFKELYHYYEIFNSDENSEIDFNDFSKINWNKIENIHCNIQDFYKSKIFIKDSFKTRDLLDKGFSLNNDSDYYNNSSDSDDY